MITYESFDQSINSSNNYLKNEDNYLNDSFDLDPNLNIIKNHFIHNNQNDSDVDTNEIYFWSPKKMNQKETEAEQNIHKIEILEKKEEKSEKNEEKKGRVINLITYEGIPGEEKIDGKGRNSKKHRKKKDTENTEKSEKNEEKKGSVINLITYEGIPSEEPIYVKGKNSKKHRKKRDTENTEKTAYSSEINEEQQNQLNKENKKISELNEINNEGNIEQLIIVDKASNNNNINGLNNNSNFSEINDIGNIQTNDIKSSKNKNVINNEENNSKVIIANDNQNTDTNSNNNENLLNKKRKRSNKLINELNCYNPDKIRKKIRIMTLRSVGFFINQQIKIIYNNDIKKGILERQFIEMNKKNLSHSTVEFDKNFLRKKLKEILSEKISEKYSNYPPDKNKKLVEELINSEIGGPYFQKLFELTFLDCLEHIRGSKKFNELIGLMNMEKMLNYEEFKIDKNDIQLYEGFINTYEKIINEKKSRKPKKPKNE